MNRRLAVKEETRAALIAAATVELGEKGLGASLDGICARAGFTRGAFYVHFRDRDQLIVAVMDHVLGTFLAALGGGSDVGDVEGAIRLFAVAASRRDPAVYPGAAVRFHHVIEACHASKVIGDRYRGLLVMARSHFAGALAAGQQGGQIRADVAASKLAQLVLAMGLGLVAMLELGVDVDPIELGETAIAIVAGRTHRW